jgi:hypothetical protein
LLLNYSVGFERRAAKMADRLDLSISVVEFCEDFDSDFSDATIDGAESCQDGRQCDRDHDILNLARYIRDILGVVEILGNCD